MSSRESQQVAASFTNIVEQRSMWLLSLVFAFGLTLHTLRSLVVHLWECTFGSASAAGRRVVLVWEH